MRPVFDSAWLREHETKMAALKPPPAASVATPNLISFALSRPTLLANTVLRMSWKDRMRHQRALSDEIASLVPHDPRRKPFQKAAVTIRRMSVGIPDHGAAHAGIKMLVDCLLVRSDRHPTGLGLCVDDDPAHMTLNVECERVMKRAEQRTVVLVEKLP